MRNRFCLIAFIFLLGIFAACRSNPEPPKNAANANSGNSATKIEPSPEATTNMTAQSQMTSDFSCNNLARKGFALDKKQTFAVDFAPFEKSCFATFHDPEFTNPALGAQFFIYENGAETFAFPEQFNGGNATCWVDAVLFEDINADQLKDIIVVGKCGAKSEAYNENMVYINTGKDFKVNKDANMEMMDFSKISQIKDYVRKHREDFAK